MSIVPWRRAGAFPDRRGFRSRPIANAARNLEFHPSPEYFTARLRRRGEASLRIAFGGLGLRLLGLAGEDEALLRARYGIFAGEGAPVPGEPQIEVVEAGVPAFLRHRGMEGDSPEFYRLEQFREGSRLYAYAYEFAGWLDRETMQGQLAVVSFRPDLLHRAAENFLRSVCAHLALERGGFLLHAAGVARQGRAHLFFGPSGSGKTTVTLLSEGDEILGDDLVLVRKGERGYEAHAVPFRGLCREAPESAGSFPLAGFYRLVQAPSDSLEALPAARGAAELLGSLPFVMEGGGGGKALEVVGRAASEVPVFRLRFRKSADFWKLLERGGDE
jgi:hypothetical protein